MCILFIPCTLGSIQISSPAEGFSAELKYDDLLGNSKKKKEHLLQCNKKAKLGTLWVAMFLKVRMYDMAQQQEKAGMCVIGTALSTVNCLHS